MIPAVHAQVDISDKNKFVISKFDSIASLVNIIVPLFIVIGGFTCLAMLLFGAYQYLSAGGNAEQLKKAQSTLLYSVIGIIIMVSSYVLVKIISFIFKVPISI